MTNRKSARRRQDDQWRFRIGKLVLRPNDVLVLQTDLMLDHLQLKALRQALKKQVALIWPRTSDRPKTMILTAGLKLRVLTKEKKREPITRPG
jgi:hypothetical protein